MQSVKPNKKVLWIWRIRVALICIIPAAFSTWLYPDGGIVKDIINIAWMVFFVGMFFIYLPIMYHRLKFSIMENDIVLDYGVIYFRAKSMPIKNVQFITITHAPLDRLFKVCTLRLTAPGGLLSISGLDEKNALSIQTAIYPIKS